MATEFAELQGHDAYSLLGVPPDASEEQIQRSFRRLIKSVHPDVHGADADVTGHAALLNAARKVLLTRRGAYDAFRRGPAVTPPVAEVKPQPEPQPEPEPEPQPVRPRTPPPPPRKPSGGWASGTRPTARPAKPKARKKSRRRIRLLPLLLAVLAIGAAITFFVNNAKNTPVPEPSVAVPAKLAGTWTGTLRDAEHKADKGWQIELTLTAGKKNGEVTYKFGDGCSGTAVPVSTWQGALVLDTVFDGDGCDLGNLYVKSVSSTKASVELHEQDKTLAGPVAKASG